MKSNRDLKGMSQIMTIILTTVLGTMIAAIVGLSAGDIIPGAFSDTGEESCYTQIETECKITNDTVAQPTACRGVEVDGSAYDWSVSGEQIDCDP